MGRRSARGAAQAVSRAATSRSSRASSATASGRRSIDEARFARVRRADSRDCSERYGLDATVDVGAVLRLPNVIATSDDEESPGRAAELVGDRRPRGRRADRDAHRPKARGSRRTSSERLRDHRAGGRAGSPSARRSGSSSSATGCAHAVQELAERRRGRRAALAQEIAILADRLDVAEEVSRFHSHFAAFRATLASPPADGVGKRLGFLLQELLREANTTGSKANDAAMLQDVILIKEELERIREQVENLE